MTTSIRTNRFGRIRSLPDYARDVTEIARRWFHRRSTSSLSLRKERLFSFGNHTPGDRSNVCEKRAGTQIQAGCPNPRHPSLFLCLSTIGRGKPQICRSGHRHDGSVSAYPSLSRARGALSFAPSALHPPPPRLPFSPPRIFPRTSRSLFLFLPLSISLSSSCSFNAPVVCRSPFP